MLIPKKPRYRKAHKGRIHGIARSGFSLSYGAVGLKALEPGRITSRQIEAARRAIVRRTRRQGKIWIRVFPDVPVSKKPTEVRMGKGKGSVEYWVARVRPGKILFELDGIGVDISSEALLLGKEKLPIKCKLVYRFGLEEAS